MINKLTNCLVNPIKCKLLIEIQTKEKVTAKQLSDVYKEIPQATLYRYLNRMVRDDILKIVEENKVRGVIERVYALNADIMQATIEALENNSSELYLHMFTQFTIGLLNEFQSYTQKENIDILKDGSGFSICPVYATINELNDASKKIGTILEPLLQNKPDGLRKLHSIAIVVTPPKE